MVLGLIMMYVEVRMRPPERKDSQEDAPEGRMSNRSRGRQRAVEREFSLSRQSGDPGSPASILAVKCETPSEQAGSTRSTKRYYIGDHLTNGERTERPSDHEQPATPHFSAREVPEPQHEEILLYSARGDKPTDGETLGQSTTVVPKHSPRSLWWKSP
jgi:hypothetical protein